MSGDSGTAARGGGSQTTGAKPSHRASASARPDCPRWAFWQHFDRHPASIPRLPTRLRVALVDSDLGLREFACQALKAHPSENSGAGMARTRKLSLSCNNHRIRYVILTVCAPMHRPDFSEDRDT